MQTAARPPRSPTALSSIRATPAALETARRSAQAFTGAGARSTTGFADGRIYVTIWRTVLGSYECAWCEIPADMDGKQSQAIAVRSSTGYHQPYRNAPGPADVQMAIASLELAAMAHRGRHPEPSIPFSRPKAMRS